MSGDRHLPEAHLDLCAIICDHKMEAAVKAFVSAVLSAFLLICSFQGAEAAEQAAEQQSQIEGFTSRRGLLISKNIYAVGEKSVYGVIDKKITIDALVIFAAGNPEKKYKGLRMEITEKKSDEEFGRSSAAFVDMDELEGLSKALAGMMDTAWKWKGEAPGAYREIFYITRGGFEMGTYSKGAEIHAYASAGRTDARSKDSSLPKTTIIFVNVGDMKEIKDIVDRGLALLKEK